MTKRIYCKDCIYKDADGNNCYVVDSKNPIHESQDKGKITQLLGTNDEYRNRNYDCEYHQSIPLWVKPLWFIVMIADNIKWGPSKTHRLFLEFCSIHKKFHRLKLITREKALDTLKIISVLMGIILLFMIAQVGCESISVNSISIKSRHITQYHPSIKDHNINQSNRNYIDDVVDIKTDDIHTTIVDVKTNRVVYHSELRNVEHYVRGNWVEHINKLYDETKK